MNENDLQEYGEHVAEVAQKILDLDDRDLKELSQDLQVSFRIRCLAVLLFKFKWNISVLDESLVLRGGIDAV